MGEGKDDSIESRPGATWSQQIRKTDYGYDWKKRGTKIFFLEYCRLIRDPIVKHQLLAKGVRSAWFQRENASTLYSSVESILLLLIDWKLIKFEEWAGPSVERETFMHACSDQAHIKTRSSSLTRRRKTSDGGEGGEELDSRRGLA